MRYRWTCPHCGRGNTGDTTVPAGAWCDTYQTAEIVHCDIEDGGCDRRVVVDVTVATNATVHKIEGE